MRILALTLALIVSGPAVAQNAMAAPIYGEISLSAGFTPDPYQISLNAGGPVSASALGAGCSGRIDDAPSLDLYYNGGSPPLILTVQAQADTTLVVRAPDGAWYCDDDGGNGLDPKLRFNSPQSGLYSVWVGNRVGPDQVPATLLISELVR